MIDLSDLSDGARGLLLTAFQVRLSLLDGPDGMLMVTPSHFAFAVPAG